MSQKESNDNNHKKLSVKNDVINNNSYICIKCKYCKDPIIPKINKDNFTISYICKNNCFLRNNKNEVYLNDFFNNYLEKKTLNEENYIFNKCSFHNYNISEYCKDCGRNVCVFCLSEEHSSHNILSYSQLLLNKKEKEKLNNDLSKNIKEIDELLSNIKNWIEKINNKTNLLITNLNLYKKYYITLTKSYRPILNYEYLSYYNELKKELNTNIFNDNLINFIKYKNNFEKKSMHLISALNNLVKSNEDIDYCNKINGKKIANFTYQTLKNYNNMSYKPNIEPLTKLKNENIIVNNENNILQLISIDKKNIFHIKSSYMLEDRVSYITQSEYNDNLLYLCLSNKKKFLILFYDEKLSLFKEIQNTFDEEKSNINNIFLGNNNNYLFGQQQNFQFGLNQAIPYGNIASNFPDEILKKIVEIDDEFIISMSNNILFVYKKNITDSSFNENTIITFKKIHQIQKQNLANILKLNSDLFILIRSSNESITFYETKSYKEIKIINNLNIMNSFYSAALLDKNYFIVICNNKLGIISIKTKEIIQLIDNGKSLYSLCCNNGYLFLKSSVPKNNFNYYNNNNFCITQYVYNKNLVELNEISKLEIASNLRILYFCKQGILVKDENKQIGLFK